MSDFSVRSDNVDVEQIMRQIRARIREKRGVDYTEEEIRELANVKLEKFIDPKGVRSNLLEEYRRVSTPEPPAPNYAFGEETLYETHRAPIRWLRALLRPFLKLLFNPNPLIQALHIQSELNQKAAERNARREQLDALHYEVIHNLVVELTRTGIEVKSLKMRLESISSRLDFDERRARALEGVVQYRPGAVAPLQPPTGQEQGRRDQRDQRRDQGGRPQQQQQQQRPQGPAPQGQPAGQPADSANALDNDGNERRARRRRRRGRRRGEHGRGESASPAGSAFMPGAAGADARDMNVAPAGEAAPNRSGEPPAGESRAEHEPVSPKPETGEGG
ncbi:MAG TPA: hypothetical protein VFK57_07265 [Vicinamibacterales bacterium]|nr:hypothetical protein [Vicinamibacterales bacterium]